MEYDIDEVNAELQVLRNQEIDDYIAQLDIGLSDRLELCYEFAQ